MWLPIEREKRIDGKPIHNIDAGNGAIR